MKSVYTAYPLSLIFYILSFIPHPISHIPFFLLLIPYPILYPLSLFKVRKNCKSTQSHTRLKRAKCHPVTSYWDNDASKNLTRNRTWCFLVMPQEIGRPQSRIWIMHWPNQSLQILNLDSPITHLCVRLRQTTSHDNLNVINQSASMEKDFRPHNRNEIR